MTVGSVVPTSRAMRLSDIALVSWAIVWAVIAVVVALQTRELKRVSDSLIASSEVLEQTGDVLGSLTRLPVVGERVEAAERDVKEAAESALASGRSSKSSIDVVSVLLGLAIGLVPTVPLVVLYLPLRLAWSREVRSVKRGLKEFGDDPAFHEFLARRAMQTHGYHELRRITVAPWRDLTNRRYERLSMAELRRLGLDRKQRPSRPGGSGFAG